MGNGVQTSQHHPTTITKKNTHNHFNTNNERQQAAALRTQVEVEVGPFLTWLLLDPSPLVDGASTCSLERAHPTVARRRFQQSRQGVSDNITGVINTTQQRQEDRGVSQ